MTLSCSFEVVGDAHSQVFLFTHHVQRVTTHNIAKFLVVVAKMQHLALGCVEGHLPSIRPFDQLMQIILNNFELWGKPRRV